MRTRLRIALIAPNRFPIRQPFAGGLEAHVWHLTRALVLEGHQVTLFADRGSDPALDHPRLTVSALNRSAAASRPFPMPGAVFESDHHAYVELMSDLAAGGAADFDVIHNHSLHQVPIVMAPRLGTPMLSTLHTPPFSWLESAIGATGGAGVRFAAVSRHTATAWSRVVDRVMVVRNGVDVDRWPVGPGGELSGVVRSNHSREGTAPGGRGGAALGSTPRTGRTHRERGLFSPRDPATSGRIGALRGTSRPETSGVAGRRRRGRPGDPVVGRAVLPGRRRGVGVRNPGRGVRPRRHTGSG